MGKYGDEILERFLRYVKIDTQSEAGVDHFPTTEKQFDLAWQLEKELKEIGASDVYVDPKACVVYAAIPSNLPDGGGLSVAFIAHMDTTPDLSGTNVNPRIVKNYQGGDIVLNEALGVVMEEAQFPVMKEYIGDDLVVTDGTTLLGGDDKSSVAIEVVLAKYLLEHPEIKHGPVKLAFTPDEEVGGGARDLDLTRLGADVAYTIDGDGLGAYNYETFNAAEAQLVIHGRSVHPGQAKGIMINSLEIGVEFMNMLPAYERCQYTEGREGYFHPYDFEATAESGFLKTLIRDHDEDRFEERKRYVIKCVEALKEKYGDERIELKWGPGYWSMKKVVDKVPFMVDFLVRAIEENGLEPKCIAARGGTDGSAISQRGLPCPNISAGYENAHSRYEFASVQAMEKSLMVVVRLCEIYGQHPELKK